MTSTSKISLLLLVLMVASAPSLSYANEGEPLPLADIAAEVKGTLKFGAGRINGQSFPISVVTLAGSERDFYEALCKRFAGEYTVTADSTELGMVVSVSDIYSEQCPQCRAADPDPRSNILGAMFFHFLPMPDGVVAMGMPGIAHLAASRPAGVYVSPTLGNIDSYLDLDLQSRYRFKDSEVQLANGTLRVSANQFLQDMGERLKQDSMRPLTSADVILSDGPMVDTGKILDRTVTWQSAAKVVSLRIRRDAFNPKTQVEIYEISNE